MNKKIKEFYKKAQKLCLNNKYDMAIEYYNKVLALDENNIESLKELGELYEKINNNFNAISCYEKILYITPKNIIHINAFYLNQIGVCYNKMLNYKKAIEYFKKTLEIKRDLHNVYDNIAVCYFNLKEYKLSEINSLISLKFNPNGTEANKHLGFLNFCIKNYEKSIYYYTNLENYSQNNDFLYNSSFSYLAKKDFRNGFSLYENRLNNNNINIQTGLKERVEIPNIQYWNGIDNCENLLILYEQGIGDNIQYYRFIIQLSQLYPKMKITYFCKDNVYHIFKEYDNIIVVKDVENIWLCNYKAYIMSLPYLLKINTITPNVENYINIDEAKVLYWKNKIYKNDNNKRINVGFFYKGLLESYIEKSIPLLDFQILTELDINLICMHKSKEVENDLKNISFNDKIISFDIDTDKAFSDTIAILKNIDVLITVDTFIAHLAGVLNVKTLLLLGNVSDWRWFANDDKVWYNSVEIMRANKNKELKHILPEVKKILEYL